MKIGEPVLTDEERRQIQGRARAGEPAAEIARDYPAAERTIQTVTQGLSRELRESRRQQIAALLRDGLSAREASHATGVPKSTITRWARTGALRPRTAREVPTHLVRDLPPWEEYLAWTNAARRIVERGYTGKALARAVGRPAPTVLERLRRARLREASREGLPEPRHGILDVHDGLLICHECGMGLRHLAGHIARRHRITLADYRKAHGLDTSVLLVTPDISAARSETSSRPEHLEKLAAARAQRGRRARSAQRPAAP